MPRIKKSKADTTNFQVIPKEDERDDDEFIRRKYGNRRLLQRDKDKLNGNDNKEMDES